MVRETAHDGLVTAKMPSGNTVGEGLWDRDLGIYRCILSRLHG